MITDAAISLPMDDFWPHSKKEYQKLLKQIKKSGYYIFVYAAADSDEDNIDNAYCTINYTQFKKLSELYKDSKEDIIIKFVTDELVKKGFRFAANCDFHIDGSD